MRNNLLIPQTQINDKNKVIQTYTLLQPEIEELMMQYVRIQLLNDETIPEHWFNAQDINNEAFRKIFKSMILKHIRPFLKSLFPFDKYDPDKSFLIQNTPLDLIIRNNYEQNLSNIMNNIYNRLIRKFNMQTLIGNYNTRYHILQRSIFKSVLEPRIEAKTFNTTRPNLNDKEIQEMNIPPDIFEELKRDLIHRWEAKQQPKPKPTPQPKPKPAPKPKPITAKNYVLNEIVMKETDPTPKTKDEINRATFKLRKGKETADTIYKYYLEQHNKRFPPPKIKKEIQPQNLDEFIKTIGYRSPNKVKSLIKNEFPNTEQSVLNNLNISSIPRFPLKENIKNYSLHHVSPPNTYIMDLIFENHKYCYLFLINVNTRKLWVEPTNVEGDEDNNIKFNQKTSELIIHAINRILQQGCKISYIKSDGERAFKSQKTIQYLNNNGIKIIEVPRQITKYPDFMQGLNMVKSISSEPYHSSLSILDRVVRTIRDLAYNLKYDIITPQRMQQLVYIYNNAPHETLTHYAGQPTTPNQADSDPELQQYITLNIKKENYLIA